jgi:hypothetical protein
MHDPTVEALGFTGDVEGTYALWAAGPFATSVGIQMFLASARSSPVGRAPFQPFRAAPAPIRARRPPGSAGRRQSRVPRP